MDIRKVDHICIAVKDLEEARKRWEPLLGKSGPDDAYEHAAENIRVVRYWIGEVGFELMASTAPDGDVARFIEKRGEGVMLVSFRVDSTRGAMAELTEKGYAFIPDSQGGTARPFRQGEYAMIHPRHLNGVLTELIDDPWEPGK